MMAAGARRDLITVTLLVLALVGETKLFARPLNAGETWLHAQAMSHAGMAKHHCCPSARTKQRHEAVIPAMPPAHVPCGDEHLCCMGSQENQSAVVPELRGVRPPANLPTFVANSLFAIGQRCWTDF